MKIYYGGKMIGSHVPLLKLWNGEVRPKTFLDWYFEADYYPFRLILTILSPLIILLTITAIK